MVERIDLCINALPHKRNLHVFKFKSFADDNFIETQTIELVFDGMKTYRKKENNNACYLYFLLFP